MNRRLVIFLAGFLIAMECATAQVLLRDAGNMPDQYLVYFENPIDITTRLKQEKSRAFELLRQNQRVNIERLKTDLSDTDLLIVKDLWINQSVAVTISSQYIDRLYALAYVDRVRHDRKYEIETQGVTTLPLSGEIVQDNLDRIGVDPVWNAGYRGQGVVVAIIDTGVDLDHATLNTRWRGGTNSWFDPFSGSTEPTDFNGHGTAVASILLGGNEVTGSIGGINMSNAYIGVAPHAQWIAARIFGSSSNGTIPTSSTSTIQEALQWVLDPDGNPATDDYPDIVQNSWGLAATEGSCTTDFNSFFNSPDLFNALGIDVVFAVGNSGPAAGSYLTPSFYNGVISVGSVSTIGAITIENSSARGPNACDNALVPALVAPGVNIVAAEKSLGSVSARRGISQQTGTSFSSPHVSGALALLRSYFDSPSDHLKFRNALFASATDLGFTGNDQNYGRGLVKVDGAMTEMLNDNTVTLKATGSKFSNAHYVFLENALNVQVALIRTGDITAPGSVSIFSENATATSGADYTPLAMTVDFLAGESIKLITVGLVNDTLGETNEYFNLVITGTTKKLRINITDDDTVVAEEDEIGGGSSGILELMFLGFLWFGLRARR